MSLHQRNKRSMAMIGADILARRVVVMSETGIDGETGHAERDQEIETEEGTETMIG